MRKFFSLILVLCMVFTLAACATTNTTTAGTTTAGTTTAGTTTAGTTTAPKEEQQLYVFIVGTDWEEEWASKMEPKFEKDYPWIKVDKVGTQAAEDFMTLALANGEIPDVYMIDNNQLGCNLADAGYVANVRDTKVAQYIPEAYLSGFDYKSQYFDGCLGITQGAAFSAIYYNMKILEEAGWTKVPANWDEFVKCCTDVEAKGYDAVCNAAQKTTTCWMLIEEIIGNDVISKIGASEYETQFKDGKFNFTTYPELAAKFGILAKHIQTGSTAYGETEATSAMAAGKVAMCIAGNWTAADLSAAITTAAGDEKYIAMGLPPFNAAGQGTWYSSTPETAFALSAKDEGAAHNEARMIFWDWVWQPENYAIIQNARGTIPVMTNLPAELVQLPAAVKACVATLDGKLTFKMGFNLYTPDFSDIACTAIRDACDGNKSAEDTIAAMWTALQANYKNKK